MKHRSQRSTFAGDVLKMASAPLFTQTLGIILMPIVTRLYDPAAYGTFSLFGSIVMPIAVFVGLGYSGSIVLPQRDEVASNMLCVSLSITLLMIALTIPLIWFGSDLLLHLLKAPELGRYLWLIPVDVLAHGLYISFRSWNVRNRRFGRIAISRISNAVVNKGVLIGAGSSGLATPGSLILGGIAGSLAMSGVLGGRIWQESGQLFKRSIRWRSMVQGMKRYRKFPMYNLWTNVFARLSNSMTIFLFAMYFSQSVIGHYGLGLVVLSMPATFVGSSIGEVFYQRAARARHEGTRASLVENLFVQMARISMLPFLLLAVNGDGFFALVFGGNWVEAGIYAQILSFKLFISFIIIPLKTLPNIFQRQELSLMLSAATAVTTLMSIIAGGLLNSVYMALFLLSVSGGLVLFGFGLGMFSLAGVSLSGIVRVLLKVLVSCGPIIVAVAVAKWWFGASTVILIAISVIGSAAYYWRLWKRDKDLRSTILTILRKAKPGVGRERNGE